MECEQFNDITLKTSLLQIINFSHSTFQTTHIYISYTESSQPLSNSQCSSADKLTVTVPANMPHSNMTHLPANICFPSSAIFIVQGLFLQFLRHFIVSLLLFYNGWKMKIQKPTSNINSTE